MVKLTYGAIIFFYLSIGCSSNEEPFFESLSFDEVSPTIISLKWVSNISLVKVLVSPSKNFSSTLVDTTTSSGEIDLNYNFYPGKKYYWRVEGGYQSSSIDSFSTLDPLAMYIGNQVFSVNRQCLRRSCDSTFTDIISFSKASGFNRLSANSELTNFDHVLDRFYFDQTTQSYELFCICPRRDIYLTIENKKVTTLIKNYGGVEPHITDVYTPTN